MKVVLSVGLKGGVGKTTVAINTARALLRREFKVGILDLDYRTPNVPIALTENPAEISHSFNGDKLLPAIIENIKVMSMAYIWPTWKCVTIEDADAMDDVLHLLTPSIIDWGDIDYLILDTPPTSVGVVKVALETPNVLGALIISHSSRVARMDTIRTIDLFAEKRVPIIGMLCNQGIDEQGTQRYDLLPEDIKKVASEYGIPFLVSIPHIRDYSKLEPYFNQIADAILSGKPVVLSVKEQDDTAWNKLVLLSKRLSGSESSSPT